MRRHRVFLLCTVGLCVISFLHYYKALHYVSLLRELSAPYPIKSFIMSTGFFWRERGLAATPLSPASPEEPPPVPQREDAPLQGTPLGIEGVAVGGRGELASVGLQVKIREEPAPPHPWEKPEERPARDTDTLQERAEDRPSDPLPNARPAPKLHRLLPRDSLSLEAMGDLHTRSHQLQDDPTPYFAHTKAGALCFRRGTEVATPKDSPARTVESSHLGQRRPLEINHLGQPLESSHLGQLRPLESSHLGQRRLLESSYLGQLRPLESSQPGQPLEINHPGQPLEGSHPGQPLEGNHPGQPPEVQLTPVPRPKPRGRLSGKRLVKCVCRPGWHGPYCGVPTMVYHSNLPTKERLTPREAPRRVINAININHEFDLLHARFHELSQAVDLFIVCESNFTAYGERRPLGFLQRLLNGTYDYVRHKLLYVFLDHFPEGGRQDGWIADDYLRTFLTRNGMSRVLGLRNDDVFVINDADEIPAHEALMFLKLFDGWTEPFALHMRKSLYGFFWKQFGSLEVISGCTVGMLRDVYDSDGIKLRRREYYTMPGFRRYENQTGHILVQWSVGSPFHFAGWHCSWCFTPEGIHFKLISAQNGDFPRWGDYEDKRDLNYIRQLIRTGGWFDGSLQEYPPADPKEHMYAPKYMLDHYDQFHYLLVNPYSHPSGGG